jgi:hypothetical protein
MIRVECNFLLYAGRWSPHGEGRLAERAKSALGTMFCQYPTAHLYSVTVESVESAEDGPRLVLRILADWDRDDASLFGDFAYQALLEGLVPEHESQLELERVEEVDPWCESAVPVSDGAYPDVCSDECDETDFLRVL